MVRTTEDYFTNVNLTINPAKSQYFGWRIENYTHGFLYDLPELRFQESPLSSLGPNRPIKYLGLEYFANKTPHIVSTKATKLLQLIDKASLKPFQKLHCIRKLVVPALLCSSSNTLQVDRESRRLNKILGMKIKQIMHLPQSFLVFLAVTSGFQHEMGFSGYSSLIGQHSPCS